MRITNNMTTNKMLLNINRNATTVDNLYNQLTTGKKIQMPSDNPIIASRALKFRTNISETEQYKRNVSQGTSWMEITEQGFSNTITIMKSIRDLCVQGSTGTLEVSDRQKIAADIENLFAQIGSEMNVAYAGRYVFSGYRTDEPPTLTENNKASYDITQMLTTADVEHTMAYAKLGAGIAPEVIDNVARLKLPYSDVTGISINLIDSAGVSVPFSGVIVSKPLSHPAYTATDNAYTPGPNDIYYVQETGELILGSNVAQNINSSGAGGIEISYTKEGFAAGELNPKVYFDCTQTKDNNGIAIPVADQKRYTMDSQNLQFEFGTNTRITINNLSKNVYTASLYADLKSLSQELAAVTLSTEAEIRARIASAVPPVPADQIEDEVKRQQTEENQKYSGILHDRFNNMLKMVDDHTAQISTEHTKLGSRMNRLELIGTRLEEDRVSYTKLMSDNENVDYLEVIMRLNSAESVYQAALQAGASIMQLSLADFIR